MARPNLRNHRKFKRLVAILGIPSPHARGHLEYIWEAAYENGNPFLGDEIDVELAAEWSGESGKLAKALFECGGEGRAGFIDKIEGGFAIHDLFDHAPDYVMSRKNAEEERCKPKVCKTCSREFRSTSAKAEFCSDRCRVANHRKSPDTTCNDDVTDGNVTDRYSNEQKRSVTQCYDTPAPAPAPAPAQKPKKDQPSAEAIPDNLNTAEFISAWSNWKTYRAEIKHKLTPSTANALLRKFGEWGQDRAIAAINYTIEMGWQGIQEPKTSDKPKEPTYQCDSDRIFAEEMRKHGVMP